MDQPYNVYREQLSSQYHGTALWEPNPMIHHYERVSIGDVGYIQEGFFLRMFNVTLPWNDPSNATFGVPEQYKTLVSDPFTNVREAKLDKGVYYSRRVSKEDSGVQGCETGRGCCLQVSGSRSAVISSSRRPSLRCHPHKGVRRLHPRQCGHLVQLGTEQRDGRGADGRPDSRIWVNFSHRPNIKQRWSTLHLEQDS
ncbi:hypothetical protein F5148DRAFT_542333 [Russula earlei]|uniref:Uncharacterized protein n=1 Tax=Russula earlei TaxID=71964 RepID=A0ACC0UIL0_9AGAM|nr:hypothetical protein F5148DRAFT_542333 [Russula earlei]